MSAHLITLTCDLEDGHVLGYDLTAEFDIDTRDWTPRERDPREYVGTTAELYRVAVSGGWIDRATAQKVFGEIAVEKAEDYAANKYEEMYG